MQFYTGVYTNALTAPALKIDLWRKYPLPVIIYIVIIIIVIIVGLYQEVDDDACIDREVGDACIDREVDDDACIDREVAGDACIDRNISVHLN